MRSFAKQAIPLTIVSLSPLLVTPWVSLRNFLLISLLVALSILISRFRYEVTIFLSLLALAYSGVAAGMSPGPFISATFFALGLLLLGWVPLRGALAHALWWLLLSVPPALVLLFLRLDAGHGVYLMLLLITVAATASYYLDPQGLRALLGGARPRRSRLDLSSAGASAFELVFYALTLYVGFHVGKGGYTIAALVLGLVARRFVDRRFVPLIVSILLLLISLV
jgi:hypothetical protein